MRLSSVVSEGFMSGGVRFRTLFMGKFWKCFCTILVCMALRLCLMVSSVTDSGFVGMLCV